MLYKHRQQNMTLKYEYCLLQNSNEVNINTMCLKLSLPPLCRSPFVLCRRRGVCRMFEWQQHLCPESQLQLSPRFPPHHCLQDPQWLQPQDLQQPRVRRAPGAVCQSRFWSSLWTHKDVHHPHELRKGMLDQNNASYWILPFLKCFDVKRVVLFSRVGVQSTIDRMWRALHAGLRFIFMVPCNGWIKSSPRWALLTTPFPLCPRQGCTIRR